MEQRAHFNEKLEFLRMRVLRMATLAERAVGKAIRAYFDGDADLADEVIEGDFEINELEDEVDRLALELLALDQPMAKDLRAIVGAMRVIMNLERLGDEAVNLAHRAVFLSTRPPMPANPVMEELAQVVRGMLADALKSFVDGDVVLADKVCRTDEEADSLFVRVLKGAINDMVGESRIVERGVHVIMAARHLERVGDLSTNLGEIVTFIVSGESIRHKYRG